MLTVKLDLGGRPELWNDDDNKVHDGTKNFTLAKLNTSPPKVGKFEMKKKLKKKKSLELLKTTNTHPKGGEPGVLSELLQTQRRDLLMGGAMNSDDETDKANSEEVQVYNDNGIVGHPRSSAIAEKILRDPCGPYLKQIEDAGPERMLIWISADSGRVVQCVSDKWMNRFGFSHKMECVGHKIGTLMNDTDTSEFNQKYQFLHRLLKEEDKFQKSAAEDAKSAQYTTPDDDRGDLVGHGTKVHLRNLNLLPYSKRFELLQRPGGSTSGTEPVVNRFSFLPWITKGDRVTAFVCECYDKERLSPAMEQALKRMDEKGEMKIWINSNGEIDDVADSWVKYWGFADRSECVGKSVKQLMNSPKTDDFNQRFGFEKKFSDALRSMHRDGYEEMCKQKKRDVKLHVNNMKLLKSAERFELLQCVYDKESGPLQKERQFKVNRFSVKPYISRRDGSIHQFVCECHNEPMSKPMQYAILKQEVYLD